MVPNLLLVHVLEPGLHLLLPVVRLPLQLARDLVRPRTDPVKLSLVALEVAAGEDLVTIRVHALVADHNCRGRAMDAVRTRVAPFLFPFRCVLSPPVTVRCVGAPSRAARGEAGSILAQLLACMFSLY